MKEEDIKDGNIALLKEQASELEGLSYTYGNIRIMLLLIELSKQRFTQMPKKNV